MFSYNSKKHLKVDSLSINELFLYLTKLSNAFITKYNLTHLQKHL